MVLDKGKACVAGGCGFIGSHLVRQLLARDFSVVAFDNLSVGSVDRLPEDPRVRFVYGDIRDERAVRDAICGCSVVFHFAAPTDVRAALTDPRLDMDHAVNGTQCILEAMRAAEVPRMVFAASSCVYGEGLPQPVDESAGPLLPSSVYGASKLAAEGLISGYCRTFGLQAWLLRFPNVAGPGVTHGVIRDFVLRLQQDPTRLTIFGDGCQTKTYLYIDDCVDGILTLFERVQATVNVFNITTRGATSVNRIAQLAADALGLSSVEFYHTGGAGGWRGDVANIQLDGTRAARLGWRAQLASDESVVRTIEAVMAETSRVPSSPTSLRRTAGARQ